MNLHGILLRRLPSHLALRPAGPLVDVLLGAVGTAIGRGPDPSRLVGSPVLIGNAIPTDRPVQPRVHGSALPGHERRVSGVPVRVRHRQGQSGKRVHLIEIDQILGRLVEATATERAAGMREIQALAIVGIIAVGLAVIGGGLIRQDGLLAVPELREAGPDMIDARFQSKHPARPDGAQGHQRTVPHAGIGLHPSLVGAGRP